MCVRGEGARVRNVMGSGNESDGVAGSCGSRGRYLRGIETLVWVGVVILQKEGGSVDRKFIHHE